MVRWRTIRRILESSKGYKDDFIDFILAFFLPKFPREDRHIPKKYIGIAFDVLIKVSRKHELMSDYTQRAKECLSQGNYDGVIDEMTKVIKFAPESAWAYHERGIIYLLKHVLSLYTDENLGRSRADLIKALRLDRTEPNIDRDCGYLAGAYLSRSQLNFEAGTNSDLAIRDLIEALRVLPTAAADMVARTFTKSYDPAMAHRIRGICYLAKSKEEDYDRAIAECNKLLHLRPNDPSAYFIRGLASSRKGNFIRGKGLGAHAIADYPQSIEHAMNCAQAQEHAIADCTQALTLDPNLAMAYQFRGELYLSNADFDGAIADFTEVLRLDPKSGDAYEDRASAYYFKYFGHRFDVSDESARQIAEVIKAQDCDYTTPRNESDRNALNRALSDAKKAVGLDPDKDSARRLLDAIKHSKSASK